MLPTPALPSQPEPARVDDLTHPPIVGRFYLVRCVLHPTLPRLWYPVMTLLDHLHCDPRFLDLRLVAAAARGEDPEHLVQRVLVTVHVAESGAPRYRPMRCLREMPATPVEPACWRAELERQNSGQRHGLRWRFKDGAPVPRLQ